MKKNYDDRFERPSREQSQILQNPVRARMVNKAEEYSWSSAKAHSRGKDDKLVRVRPMLEKIKDWRERSGSNHHAGNQCFVDRSCYIWIAIKARNFLEIIGFVKPDDRRTNFLPECNLFNPFLYIILVMDIYLNLFLRTDGTNLYSAEMVGD